jgi:hypothetical protein
MRKGAVCPKLYHLAESDVSVPPLKSKATGAQERQQVTEVMDVSADKDERESV